MAEHGILLAHPGTQHSYHLAREFERLHLLQSFHTGFSIPEGGFLDLFSSHFASAFGFRRQFENRLLADVPREKVFTYSWIEGGAYLKRALGRNEAKVFHDRNRRFQEIIPSELIGNACAVVGYDTSSRVLADRARQLGTAFIVERTTPDSRLFTQVSEIISDRYPEWRHCSDSAKKPLSLIYDEDAEHELADLIVVPSRFVSESLLRSGVLESKIRINPYGCDLSRFWPSRVNRTSSEAMIFLFVGAIRAAKGVPVLIDAWRSVRRPGWALWIAGSGQVPQGSLRGLEDSVKLLGCVAQTDLPALYRGVDVFVFPSLFEGLARVQIEAAASGLPIIGSDASGATDIVDDGQTGFIVRSGDSESLASAMDALMSDGNLLESMKISAANRSSQWGWNAYGERWRGILRSLRVC